MALDVLYEDNHLLVVNKPNGVLVQGDHTGRDTLLEQARQYTKEKYNKPGNVFLGVVHRLDRPVSGVVLLGRTTKATVRLNEAFRSKKLKKTYLAIVETEPPLQEDILTGYMSKVESKNKSYFSKDPQNGKHSELHYRWIGSSGQYHLLEVHPVTGRHHQIRVMLSSIGCPIKGDIKYGAKHVNKDGNICLHARSLKFTHPVRKEPYCIVAPTPDQKIWKDFEEVI